MENNKEIIYGVHSVLEVLQTSTKGKFKKIILSEVRKHDSQIIKILTIAEKKKIEIVKKSKAFIDSLTGTIKNQGIVGIILKKNLISLAELLCIVEKKKITFPTLLIADGIEDPHNLGALIRSASALGIDGLILPKRRCAGITPTVYKTSAGALEHLLISQTSNIINAINILKKNDYTIIAVDMGGDVDSYNTNFLTPSAIIFGGENLGVRQIIKNKSDWIVSIPQMGGVSSLNVSCAGAIIFYEIMRQKIIKNNV